MSKCHSVYLSKAWARESRGRKWGGEREETRDSRSITGMQDDTDFRLPLSSCRGGRGLVRAIFGGVSVGRGNGGQKVSRILYAERLHPEGKYCPKPPFSSFSVPMEISLRQDFFVFAARNSFLSAKKFHFVR